ncbi:hypothetical protein QO034_05475 [Sedimentitalea sp. JM2-8]|uniref:Uncharacterized protein n=1 Tax=Sedimentitalea xiamensis TaxID=3050037 RepID=A0ABT7FBR3_9RHOB|nr:hypothetical protein [Sedimentitalea xiamensis]MDK3072556.1 hypothetical protein [Sedimentitalea xiamensis]
MKRKRFWWQRFADFQAAALLPPPVEGHRSDALPTAGAADLYPGLILFQHADDSLFAEPSLLSLTNLPPFYIGCGSVARNSFRKRWEKRHGLNSQTPNLTGSSNPDEVCGRRRKCLLRNLKRAGKQGSPHPIQHMHAVAPFELQIRLRRET